MSDFSEDILNEIVDVAGPSNPTIKRPFQQLEPSNTDNNGAIMNKLDQLLRDQQIIMSKLTYIAYDIQNLKDRVTHMESTLSLIHTVGLSVDKAKLKSHSMTQH